jgi:hypothetical protein|nr:MAG TPA: CAP-associated protein [Caudoviricetes sp.]
MKKITLVIFAFIFLSVFNLSAKVIAAGSTNVDDLFLINCGPLQAEKYTTINDASRILGEILTENYIYSDGVARSSEATILFENGIITLNYNDKPTINKDDSGKIYKIICTKPNVSTIRGISIGSSENLIVSKYGTPGTIIKNTKAEYNGIVAYWYAYHNKYNPIWALFFGINSKGQTSAIGFTGSAKGI